MALKTFKDECRVVFLPPKKGTEGGRFIIESRSPPAPDEVNASAVAHLLDNITFCLSHMTDEDVKKCVKFVDEENAGLVHMFLHKLLQAM